MLRTKIAISVVLVTGYFLNIGCDGSGSVTPSSRSDSPMKVLENMEEAMESGNAELFKSCFNTSAKEAEMLGSLCEFVSTGRQFAKQMQQTYGGDELQIMSGFAGHDIFCNKDWLDNVNIDISGTRAIVTSSAGGGELLMAKKGDVWKIDFHNIGLPDKDDSDEELAGVNEWFRVRARHMSEAQKKIDKPGYTAQRIMQELREAESASEDRIHVSSSPSNKLELTSESEKCLNQIGVLERALWLYAHQHSGGFPDPERWHKALINEGMILPENFACPVVSGQATRSYIDYVMVPWPGPDSFREYDTVVKRDLLVLFERDANHNGRRSVATADHIPTMIAEPKFRRKLAVTSEKLKEKGIDFQWHD